MRHEVTRAVPYLLCFGFMCAVIASIYALNFAVDRATWSEVLQLQSGLALYDEEGAAVDAEACERGGRTVTSVRSMLRYRLHTAVVLVVDSNSSSSSLDGATPFAGVLQRIHGAMCKGDSSSSSTSASSSSSDVCPVEFSLRTHVEVGGAGSAMPKRLDKAGRRRLRLMTQNEYALDLNPLTQGIVPLQLTVFVFPSDGGLQLQQPDDAITTGGTECVEVDEGRSAYCVVLKQHEEEGEGRSETDSTAAVASAVRHLLGVQHFTRDEAAALSRRITQHNKESVVCGLQQLARLVETHPEVPVPLTVKGHVGELQGAVRSAEWVAAAHAVEGLVHNTHLLPQVQLPEAQELAVVAPLFVPMFAAVLVDTLKLLKKRGRGAV